MNAGLSSDPFGRGYLSTLDQHSDNFDNVCNDSNSIDLESKLSPSLFSDEEFNCDDNTNEVDCKSLPETIPIRKQRQPTVSLRECNDDCDSANSSENTNTCESVKSEIEAKPLPGRSPTKIQQQATISHSDFNFDCTTVSTSLWIKDLGLTYADKQLIEDGYNINAAVINASSTLIKQENDSLAGLLPIAPSGGYKGNGELFVQILRANNEHWVTMSNVFTDYGNVSIYDRAMRLHYRHNTKEIWYNVAIELDACNLRALSVNKMTLFVEDTLQVKKDSDSGIATIMFALAIARNLDPQTINFNYKQLRKRVIECLENSSFSSLTCKDSPRRQLKRKFDFTGPLFSHCNKPDLGECMIQCGTCANWFHMSCEFVEVEGKDWKCKTWSDSGTLDMLHHAKQVESKDTYDHLGASSIEGISWKQLVNSVAKEYRNSCKTLDLASFEQFVKSSLQKAWVHTLLDDTVVDFLSTLLIGAMDDASIQLICKYTSTLYEHTFDIIYRVIIVKNLCKFSLGQRGADRPMLVGAKILQTYFEDNETSSGPEML